MNESKISIVIPVYNAEKYIAKCIESILHQTYINWELLLIDDGSKDSSKEICESFEKIDSRIKYIYKDNGGVSSARNVGIDNAKGEYISFVDSDDFVEEDYCLQLVSLKEEQIGLVALGLNKYDANGNKKIVSHRLSRGKISYNDMCKILVDDGTMSGFTLHSACATLFETNIINAKHIRFNEKVKFNEDGLFVTEYVLLSQKDIFVDYGLAIYNYRTNYESASQTVDVNSESYKESMAEIFRELKKYPLIATSKQIEKRNITLFINKLAFLAKTKKLTAKEVRGLYIEDDIAKTLPILNSKKMNFAKKILYIVLRMRLYIIASLIINLRYRK